MGSAPQQGLSFEQLERGAREQALRTAAEELARQLNEDHSDCTGSTTACPCGGTARYQGRRARRFVTAVGEMVLTAAYYHCETCGHGFYPRDWALGLDGTRFSPAVTRMIALVGATVSFQEGSELLGALAGVQLGSKRVERAAKRLGGEIAADEREVVEPDPGRDPADTLYLAVDGTGVPMRKSAVAGRAGKQPDGTAKTREAKLCIVLSAESRDKDGNPTRDRGSVSYTGAIETAACADTNDEPSPFAQRVVREAHRRRFFEAKRRVVLGDGAHFIRNLAEEHFPGTIQVLDRFHAKEHLSDAAKAIWPTQGDNFKRWHAHREAELDAGTIELLVERLNVHAHRRDDLPSCEEALACANYFNRNRERMRYAKFRQEGLCTSTGVLEAACKTAIGSRLKRSGMHWSEEGANAIIALRCAKLSDRLDAFFQRRYPAKAAA
jgi:hypothetical protein